MALDSVWSGQGTGLWLRMNIKYTVINDHPEVFVLNIFAVVKVKVTQSCPTLCDPMDCMEFSRPEYWSGIPPSPGDLPNPGIKPRSPHRRQILYQLSHKIKCGLLQLSLSDLSFTSSSKTHTPLCTHTSHLCTLSHAHSCTRAHTQLTRVHTHHTPTGFLHRVVAQLPWKAGSLLVTCRLTRRPPQRQRPSSV